MSFLMVLSRIQDSYGSCTSFAIFLSVRVSRSPAVLCYNIKNFLNKSIMILLILLMTGQVFVWFPLSYLTGWACENGIGIRTTSKLPNAWEMIVDILGIIIVDEILFYYSHRLCHEWSWLYQNVHKIHHEFTYPCALVAAYCHPFEMMISNVLPLGAGSCDSTE